MLIVVWYLFLMWCAALYFGHCVFDSAKGGTHAPAIWSGYRYTGGELPSVLLLSVVALCLGPCAFYRVVAGDTDLSFWTLASAGAFLLPMLLLACTLWGGGEALNPALIATSIAATFPAYLGLIARLALLASLAGAAHWCSRWLGVPRVLPYAAHLYLLWIAGHLLGRFYLRQKDKLGWDL